MVFEGCCVALVTPFSKSGEVNYYVLKQLIEFQIASGTKAILILGTTGECSTITDEERKKIIRFCVCLIAGRVPLIVGTGSNSTVRAITLTKEAKQLGADACLVVTPYYNKCNQNGLFQHYKKISDECSFPIILYNVPSRTGVNMLPETVLKLAKLKNIVGIKEASVDINHILKLFHLLPRNFAIYSGNDSLNFLFLSLGAKGSISVTANCYPTMTSSMCDFGLKRDYFNALRIHDFLFDLNSALCQDINPICVKEYLNLIGFDVGGTRLPLTRSNTEIIKKLKEIKISYEG